MLFRFLANAVGHYERNSFRSAQPTDQNGITEIQSGFPSFTLDDANHVNMIIHRPGVTSTEYVATVAHVGRLFFTSGLRLCQDHPVQREHQLEGRVGC